MQEKKKLTVELTIVGEDKKGIVASFTNLIFKNGGNIEEVNQNVHRGLFGMQLEASFEHLLRNENLCYELGALGKKLKMEVSSLPGPRRGPHYLARVFQSQERRRSVEY